MKTLTLNGHTFKVTRPRKDIPSNCTCGMGSENSIYEHYGRPSDTKVAIWESWLKWAKETDGVTDFNICSANGYMFTIHGFYYDEENDHGYNIYITPSKNELIEVF